MKEDLECANQWQSMAIKGDHTCQILLEDRLLPLDLRLLRLGRHRERGRQVLGRLNVPAALSSWANQIAFHRTPWHSIALHRS